jgi:hypothetical protein
MRRNAFHANRGAKSIPKLKNRQHLAFSMQVAAI